MDQVDAWRDAGLYDPDGPGAADRLALLQYLTEHGATVEQMVVAHRMGTLPGVASDLVTQGRTDLITVTELAFRCGLSTSRVMRALLAAGIPAEAETLVPADLGALLAAFEQGAALMGEDAILAFTRVLGAAAINVAEAAIALFLAELGPGTVREGPDELARARLAEAATTAFTRPGRPGAVGARCLREGAAPSRSGPVLAGLQPSRRRGIRRPVRDRGPRFCRPRGVDCLGPDPPSAGTEPGAGPVRVSGLDERRAGRRSGDQDDRRRGLLRGPDRRSRLPDRGSKSAERRRRTRYCPRLVGRSVSVLPLLGRVITSGRW